MSDPEMAGADEADDRDDDADGDDRDGRAAQAGGAGAVGYRRPPAATRFRKGQSGNPGGRPRGRSKAIPYEAVLGRGVVVREDGAERQVTAAEAFLLHMAKRGLEGDGRAARALGAALEGARAGRSQEQPDEATEITILFVRMGSVTSALTALRLAAKLDRLRPTARMALEPWVVEAALRRLGPRRLTRAEQATVWRTTRTPHKVNWPDWWGTAP